jgi:hypothetical protein
MSIVTIDDPLHWDDAYRNDNQKAVSFPKENTTNLDHAPMKPHRIRIEKEQRT